MRKMLKLGIVAFAFKIAVFFLLIFTTSIHAENAKLHQELQNSWINIFPTGNRNAGGPLFFNHIFEKYKKSKEFLEANKLYCPVSGSFIRPKSIPDLISVAEIGSEKLICGKIYRCCWPCSCDVMRSVKVKKEKLRFSDRVQDIYLLLIKNPCKKSEFPQQVSRNLFCNGENINAKRIYTVDGMPVIGVLHQAAECTKRDLDNIKDNWITGRQCMLRNYTPIDNLQGGMGGIFNKLAQ